MLALLPRAEVEAILRDSDVKAWTSETITEREALLRELDRIREQGYAYNNQGIALGVRGIASAIVGKGGRPIAAVNLSIARPLTQEQVTQELAPAVTRAAREISARAVEIGIA